MATEIPFEKALERLEAIVEDLETGSVSLDEALKKYEEGVKLAAVCQERLTQAEKKIEVLARAQDGNLKKKNFVIEEEAGEEETPGTRRKKNTKMAPPDNNTADATDKDLLF